jgi:hypothetical protein
MKYALKIMLSALFIMAARVWAMEIGDKISFSSPHYQSGRVFVGEIGKCLKELIEDKSPEQFQTIPAIAVYVACCKKDSAISDWKDAYLVFTKAQAVVVHASWIKGQK